MPKLSELTDELVEVFRSFEAELWQRINAPDSDAERQAVARYAATELARIQDNVHTELEIVSG